ncbi:hypothetical protein BRADI_1g29675v3 [Brachypodium distachyon]|uniref:Uncharacterized protein n=1 Tax=Brachypodium distachyon TaxID=15368 RepID=A0A2K2DM02_BRADI|nr:hypothetical protein BRADI_1g29675v3 [Brachypodium distachyon]
MAARRPRSRSGGLFSSPGHGDGNGGGDLLLLVVLSLSFSLAVASVTHLQPLRSMARAARPAAAVSGGRARRRSGASGSMRHGGSRGETDRPTASVFSWLHRPLPCRELIFNPDNHVHTHTAAEHRGGAGADAAAAERAAAAEQRQSGARPQQRRSGGTTAAEQDAGGGGGEGCLTRFGAKSRLHV